MKHFFRYLWISAVCAGVILLARPFFQENVLTPRRIERNEAKIRHDLACVFKAQVDYAYDSFVRNGTIRMTNSMPALISLTMHTLTGADNLDRASRDGYHGYYIEMDIRKWSEGEGDFKRPIYDWVCKACPIEYGKTGLLSFCVDFSGFLRAEDLEGQKAGRRMPVREKIEYEKHERVFAGWEVPIRKKKAALPDRKVARTDAASASSDERADDVDVEPTLDLGWLDEYLADDETTVE